MSTFSDKMKTQEEQAKKEGISAGGSNWYKFVEGDNIFRVLAEPEMIFEKYKVGICYTDCGYQGTAKFLTWVQDMRDSAIKLAKLPYSVGEQIAAFQTEEGYEFDTFPMPYNIKVKAKNAGTKEVKYNIFASPKKSDVEPWVVEEMSKKAKLADITIKMKEKKKQEHIDDGSWAKEQNRKAKLTEELAGAREGSGESTGIDRIEYPADDINIDDIPF